MWEYCKQTTLYEKVCVGAHVVPVACFTMDDPRSFFSFVVQYNTYRIGWPSATKLQQVIPRFQRCSALGYREQVRDMKGPVKPDFVCTSTAVFLI